MEMNRQDVLNTIIKQYASYDEMKEDAISQQRKAFDKWGRKSVEYSYQEERLKQYSIQTLVIQQTAELLGFGSAECALALMEYKKQKEQA